MSETLPFGVEAADSAKSVIVEADVIVTATGKITKPIFKSNWIRKGALILPVHTRGWEKDTPGKVDKFIVDHWDQFRRAQEREGGYYESLPGLYAELGEIVAGKKPGRENASECIIDHNYGMAIHDVALAKEIFRRAIEKGLGTICYIFFVLQINKRGVRCAWLARWLRGWFFCSAAVLGQA